MPSIAAADSDIWIFLITERILPKDKQVADAF